MSADEVPVAVEEVAPVEVEAPAPEATASAVDKTEAPVEAVPTEETAPEVSSGKQSKHF